MENQLRKCLLLRVVSFQLTNVSEELTPSIIRAMMEAANTSETSVNFYQTTRRNIPEDSHHLNNCCLFF
jgi:NADPH-dependent 7-cyano-7-deazaguanine reductase QueF